MKILILLCNLVLFAFTCTVLLGDGWSSQPAYIVLTLLLLMVPVLSAVVIAAGRWSAGWLSVSRVPRLTAAACNAVLIAFAAWALVDSYPHPAEPGFGTYVAVVLLVPTLSLVVLLRGGSRQHAAAG